MALAKRRMGGAVLGTLFGLIVIGVMVWHLFPNVIARVVPGKGGVSGEWVGLVKWQNDMMSNRERSAAVKYTLTPTGMTNVVPMFSMSGELQFADSAAPAKFVAEQVIIDGGKPTMNAVLGQSSDSRLAGGILSGELQDRSFTFDFQSGSRTSTASAHGEVKRGTDADYDALVKHLQ